MAQELFNLLEQNHKIKTELEEPPPDKTFPTNDSYREVRTDGEKKKRLRKEWSPEEDKILRRAIKREMDPFEIATILSIRTPIDVRAHIGVLNKRREAQNLPPLKFPKRYHREETPEQIIAKREEMKQLRTILLEEEESEET